SATLIALGFVIILSFSRYLDVLLLGEESAKGLGMNIEAARSGFLILAALLAGAAVSVAGLLSFVGLIVPNAVRKTVKCDSFHLMLLSALLGGGFVSISDTVARSLFAPYEIPVGIIMAFIGAPFFVFILIRGKGGKRE
ncbi:MAG: iron chelate uptake ABC transporter family permease subunit, partial [Clostridia bacterium]|nr:iron chelate uptake ABC transporter family permease subunit [Clostridia bacterium]